MPENKMTYTTISKPKSQEKPATSRRESQHKQAHAERFLTRLMNSQDAQESIVDAWERLSTQSKQGGRA